MNLSSTSSFLGYSNSTSSGGNTLYLLHERLMMLIDNGNIVYPNYTTRKAINDSELGLAVKFAGVDDCLDFLND